MRQQFFILLCALLVGCSAATVGHVLDSLSTTDHFLTLVKVAVALSSPDEAHNEEGYAELIRKNGIDLKTPVDGFTDAAKALIETAKHLRNSLKTSRGISEDDRALLEDLDRILPEEPKGSP